MLKLVELQSKDPKEDELLLSNLDEKYFNVGYRETVEAKRETIVAMQEVLPWINRGFRVIDLFESIRLTGGMPPHIAITRLFGENTGCQFECWTDGAATYFTKFGISVLALPPRTFKTGFWRNKWTPRYVTEAPLVEKARVNAILQMDGVKPDADILLAWETENWKAIPKPLLDPIILKKFPTRNNKVYAVILTAWDITPAEHLFMRSVLES